MAFFTPSRLRVIVSLDRISLVREDGKRWDHPAQVWWDDQTKQVTGIGNGPIPKAAPVPLFQPSQIPRDKLPLLERFFMVALGNAIADAFLRWKPRVVVEGVDSLESALAGYQRGALRTALLAGGAMSVTFE
jgi:hypothetical protein